MSLSVFKQAVSRIPWCSSRKLIHAQLANASTACNNLLCRTSSERFLLKSSSALLNSKCSGARFLHTESDREFAEFLEKEIVEEKQNAVPMRTHIKDFKIEVLSGADVTLTREHKGEIIQVKANVNSSMDDDSEASADPNAEPQMVCRPSIDVYITKSSHEKTLVIRCDFPQPEFAEEGERTEQYEDVIVINEICMLKKDEELTPSTFTVAGSVMDNQFYDHLLSMLEDRGVDGAFCDQFVNFVTEYEHDAYIKFLQQVKSFTESK